MSIPARTESDRRWRVLIVEDEPVLAYVLEALLIEEGFEIAGVAARIERGICDAAVIDANLAGISAGPAASALTARGLPFIILSGYSPDQQQCAFSGALRLQKPCRPERLVEALRSILPAQ